MGFLIVLSFVVGWWLRGYRRCAICVHSEQTAQSWKEAFEREQSAARAWKETAETLQSEKLRWKEKAERFEEAALEAERGARSHHTFVQRGTGQVEDPTLTKAPKMMLRSARVGRDGKVAYDPPGPTPWRVGDAQRMFDEHSSECRCTCCALLGKGKTKGVTDGDG